MTAREAPRDEAKVGFTVEGGGHQYVDDRALQTVFSLRMERSGGYSLRVAVLQRDGLTPRLAVSTWRGTERKSRCEVSLDELGAVEQACRAMRRAAAGLP